MNRYLVFLGQNAPLAQAELLAVFPKSKHQTLAPNLISLSSTQDLTPFFSRLGGSLKAARQIATTDSDLPAKLAKIIIDLKHKNFSLSLISSSAAETKLLSQQVKSHLAKASFPARFISSRSALSPVIIDKQHVTELTVDPTTKQIFHTLWVHDYHAWIARDRYKPFITPKSGMIPPKLARIMVNLALKTNSPRDLTLLDPFCGSGTILMEASLLGLNVTGSDLDYHKVAGAQKNLTWLPQSHYLSLPTKPPQLFASDALHLAQHTTTKFDFLVTEPFLGRPSPKDSDLPNLVRGLGKLYQGVLKRWRQNLAPQATVVIAFPRFHYSRGLLRSAAFIDTRENLGYNTACQPLVFTRPNAQIEREIHILVNH